MVAAQRNRLAKSIKTTHQLRLKREAAHRRKRARERAEKRAGEEEAAPGDLAKEGGSYFCTANVLEDEDEAREEEEAPEAEAVEDVGLLGYLSDALLGGGGGDDVPVEEEHGALTHPLPDLASDWSSSSDGEDDEIATAVDGDDRPAPPREVREEDSEDRVAKRSLAEALAARSPRPARPARSRRWPWSSKGGAGAAPSRWGRRHRSSTFSGPQKGVKPRLSVLQANEDRALASAKGLGSRLAPPRERVPSLTPELADHRSSEGLSSEEHAFSLRPPTMAERELDLQSLFHWFDADNDGSLDPDELYRGIKHLAQACENAADSVKSFAMTLKEVKTLVANVPRGDSKSIVGVLPRSDFVAFGMRGSAPLSAQNAHRKICLMLDAWLVKKRLKRYSYRNYDNVAAAFYAAIEGSEKKGRMDAPSLVQGLAALGVAEGLADAYRIIDKQGSVDKCVDIDQFLAIAATYKKFSLRSLLQKLAYSWKAVNGRASRATLARLFWEYDVEDTGEIDGRQVGLLLGELASMERSIGSERMKQMFDVSGCSSTLFFYDLPLFYGLIHRLRRVRTRTSAKAMLTWVCREYQTRDKPVPCTTLPSPTLGEVDHMVKLNQLTHRKEGEAL